MAGFVFSVRLMAPSVGLAGTWRRAGRKASVGKSRHQTADDAPKPVRCSGMAEIH
jgi:hypothetical protein